MHDKKRGILYSKINYISVIAFIPSGAPVTPKRCGFQTARAQDAALQVCRIRPALPFNACRPLQSLNAQRHPISRRAVLNDCVPEMVTWQALAGADLVARKIIVIA